MKKSCDLRNEVPDSGRATYRITHNKGKEPVIPTDVDSLVDYELSLGSSLYLGLSPAKNIRAKLRKRTSHRPAFSNVVSGAQLGGSTSQTEPLVTHWYCLQA